MIWKDVKGYEGLYQVSDTGKVKSLIQHKNRGPRVLSDCVGSNGYPVVVLCKNGKKTSRTVHRLVATAFIQNPDKYPCINHKDENKTNNSVSNLEWCSYRYNGLYGLRGKILEDKKKPVAEYAPDGKLIRVYESRCSAAKEVGGNAGSITRAINGERKTYKGHIWKEWNNGYVI